ncbi:MAG: hypothetical protein RIB71_04520, partial [Imperialibacter sp.]|uniref:hypothetical protein n=1 Tax=Imperialibacter sp. TaxID=2038411 RepID=UPI0032ED1396
KGLGLTAEEAEEHGEDRLKPGGVFHAKGGPTYEVKVGKNSSTLSEPKVIKGVTLAAQKV